MAISDYDDGAVADAVDRPTLANCSSRDFAWRTTIRSLSL